MDSHYLMTGKVHVSRKPCLITTVLGSCISICLFDETTGIGGMNHFKAPYWEERYPRTTTFGDIALSSLINKMQREGSRIEHMKAIVVGGGEVIKTPLGMPSIGEINIKAAFELLARVRIRIVSEDVGGAMGRRVMFETHTGKVTLKPINSLAESVEMMKIRNRQLSLKASVQSALRQ